MKIELAKRIIQLDNDRAYFSEKLRLLKYSSDKWFLDDVRDYSLEWSWEDEIASLDDSSIQKIFDVAQQEFSEKLESIEAELKELEAS